MSEEKQTVNASKPKEKKSTLAEITPLKDHVIRHNEFHYDLKKGEKSLVDKKFLDALKAEKVIK